jgi:demethylmenaquinone methyltransferase/2-methoxy-6-polyprenyl-1,4-benzoquinol methylase
VIRSRELVDAMEWSGRDVLELAPGTGLWTERLLASGASLTVVDASPAMLERLKARLGAAAQSVEMVRADLFSFEAPRQYGGVFAGFFVSHVPRVRLAGFFQMVARALAPDGLFAMVDSLREESSTARDHVLPDGEVMERRLDDGRSFRVVKNFYEAEELSSAAASAGLELAVTTTGRYFLVARGSRVK